LGGAKNIENLKFSKFSKNFGLNLHSLCHNNRRRERLKIPPKVKIFLQKNKIKYFFKNQKISFVFKSQKDLCLNQKIKRIQPKLKVFTNFGDEMMANQAGLYCIPWILLMTN